ncbi:MAG TPA: hypothetical protein VFR85_12665 [Anaeromyxobacteraceae bacterium]|nr:hypothetical protein [Anaeromyxobacteraceae bacterium]
MSGRPPPDGPRRWLALALLGLWAAPALAYVLPVSGILKRMGHRREELALTSLEVRGTFAMPGDPARAAAATLGLSPVGAELSAPALLAFKMPGRCRLELWPPDLPESERPAAVVRSGQLSGVRGLDRVPAAAAMLRGVCALLGQRPGGPEPDRPYAQELARLGVPLAEAVLGRFNGQVAYVIGARPAEPKPQAWVDKRAWQPVRVLFQAAGGLADVRFLDWGSPTGGDWFPRAVEVHQGGALQARFVTEKAAANPRIPDTLF